MAELQSEQGPPKSLLLFPNTLGEIFFNYNELFCHIKYLYKEGLSLTYLQVESLLSFCSELVISEWTPFSHILWLNSGYPLCYIYYYHLPPPEGRHVNPTPSSLVTPVFTFSFPPHVPRAWELQSFRFCGSWVIWTLSYS